MINFRKTPRKKIYAKLPLKSDNKFLTLIMLLAVNIGFRKKVLERRIQQSVYENNRLQYNLAVYEFNRHPAYYAHKELLAKYSASLESFEKNELMIKNLEKEANKRDYSNQWLQFASGYFVEDATLQLSNKKKQLLLTNLYKTLADCEGKKVKIKGFGGFSMFAIYQWQRQIETIFIYEQNQEFVDNMKIKLIKLYPLQKMRLKNQLEITEAGLKDSCLQLRQAASTLEEQFPYYCKAH